VAGGVGSRGSMTATGGQQGDRSAAENNSVAVSQTKHNSTPAERSYLYSLMAAITWTPNCLEATAATSHMRQSSRVFEAAEESGRMRDRLKSGRKGRNQILAVPQQAPCKTEQGVLCKRYS
jgi:hypothetical protein